MKWFEDEKSWRLYATFESRLFHVRCICCNNPDCACRKVTLQFVVVRIQGDPRSTCTSFQVTVDVDDWTEARAPAARPPEEQRLVDSVLRDAPEDFRQEISGRAAKVKAQARQEAAFTMPADEVRQGDLVSFTEVIAEGGSIRKGGDGVAFAFHHGGEEILGEDLYCANPTCRCREFSVVFMRNDSLARTLVDLCRAAFSLDGRLKEVQGIGCSESDAGAIVASWQEQNPTFPNVATNRYKKIKKIGARVLREDRKARPRKETPRGGDNFPETLLVIRDAPSTSRSRVGPGAPGSLVTWVPPTLPPPLTSPDPDPLPTSPLRPDTKSVGRNDPCPCGSGKKFKKCCLGKK